MLRHVVLFRRKAEVDRAAELEAALVTRMQSLGAQIPAVRQWRVVANEVQRPVCWDYLLDCQVDDVQGLDAYLLHPLHQALVADLRLYFEWAAVDYTLRPA